MLSRSAGEDRRTDAGTSAQFADHRLIAAAVASVALANDGKRDGLPGVPRCPGLTAEPSLGPGG
jgi:hypothetical protein